MSIVGDSCNFNPFFLHRFQLPEFQSMNEQERADNLVHICSLIVPLPPILFGISDTFFWNLISIVVCFFIPILFFFCFVQFRFDRKVCVFLSMLAIELVFVNDVGIKSNWSKRKTLYCSNNTVFGSLFWFGIFTRLFNLFEWSVHHFDAMNFMLCCEN